MRARGRRPRRGRCACNVRGEAAALQCAVGLPRGGHRSPARVAELHPPAPHRLLAADRRALRRDNRPTAADVYEGRTGHPRARRTGGGINDHEPAAMNAHHGRLVIFSLSMSGFISCSARGCGRRRSCRRCQFPCCDTSCCIVDIYIIFGGGLTYDKNLPAA